MNTTSQNPIRRDVIANIINRYLPSAYRSDIKAERERLEHDVLAPMDLDERRILIAGGAGYTGSVLTGHFLTAGYHVRCLDDLVFNNGLTVLAYLGNPHYEFRRGDLASEADFGKAIEGITDVVLLAGLAEDPITKQFPDEAARVNDVGHASMLNVLRGAKLNRIIFVSTCSNYGLIEGDVLANEEFELNPLSLYAKSKVQVEKNLLAMADNDDLTVTILRFATAFGLRPRMRFDLTVSEFTRAMFLKEDLFVYDADTWRPYCHVADFAELIRRVLEAPRERIHFNVFNAGGDVNNFTKQMMVDAVLEQLPSAPVRYQAKGADPRNYRVSFEKVRKQLFFEPAYTVRDGVRELISAMNQALFLDITAPESFYGN